MRVGASLFLIALGAILKLALTKQVSGIELSTVGNDGATYVEPARTDPRL